MTPKGNKNYRTHPLDLELLKRLPPEGSQLGFHVIASTILHLKTELNKLVPDEAALTSHQIHGRISSMKFEGLVVLVPVQASGSGVGYQRTKKGEKHYEKETGQKLEGFQREEVK